MARTLDAAALRAWYRLALSRLRSRAAELDASNVYPVADADTGANLVATLAGAVAGLDAVETGSVAEAGSADAVGSADGVGSVDGAGLGVLVDHAARGALTAARGNSGVILAQLLCGLAERWAGHDEVDGAQLAAALVHAAELARSAVATPVEGTVLSVARAAADAALASTEHDPEADVLVVSTAATVAASQALARTPSQLAALARAGVVDAGGRGLLIVLQALVTSLGGDELAESPPDAGTSAPATDDCPSSTSGRGDRPGGPGGPGYEVQYLLADAVPAAADDLRTRLAAIGDSVVVVGHGGCFSVHVHTDLIGPAVEAGITAGRPHRIQVIRFADQPAPTPTPIPSRTPTPTAGGPARAGTGAPSTPLRRVVVVLDGPGLAAAAVAAEPDVIVLTPQQVPDEAALAGALRHVDARELVLLPNGLVEPTAAAGAASRLRAAGREALVVPTGSPLQGLAALAVHDPQQRLSDAVVGLSSAAGGARWAEVVLARTQSLTTAGICQPGDALGLVGGEVVLIVEVDEHAEAQQRVRLATFGLLDRLLGAGGELVTVATGLGAPAGLGADVERYVAATRPGVEVVTLAGGQPLRPVLLAAE